ncbi:MAG TPA: superinfection immunity protein [Acidobacteriaceae bacterium]|nr:superinfection immunity protein [Acidobacteriaceae bacterium]
MLDNLFTPSHLLVFLPFLLVWAAIYILPVIVAVFRGHHNRMPIILVNILLGWTVIGWIVALVWAFTSPAPISQPG